MNVLVWILQGVLAFLYLTGGAYKTFNADELLKGAVAFPKAAWMGLGVFEMVGAVLLIVPAALRWKQGLTPVAATALAAETLILAAIYASYSTTFTVENPMPWALVMGILAVTVTYGTYARYASKA